VKTFEELKALIEQRGTHQVFGSPGEGFAIEQNADELARFLVVCQELGVTSCLEIGTGYRAGLARFLHDDMNWQVVSVDIHDYGHEFGGIRFLTLDNPDTWGQFDLIIIDADHSYDAVKADDARWRPHAEKLLMFHDIAGLRECEGVRDYWNEIAYDGSELKPGYHEIITDTPERGGIGYIVLAEVAAEAGKYNPGYGEAPIKRAIETRDKAAYVAAKTYDAIEADARAKEDAEVVAYQPLAITPSTQEVIEATDEDGNVTAKINDNTKAKPAPRKPRTANKAKTTTKRTAKKK
jgi:hypothetical protein